MKAVVFHGIGDVRLDEVPEPKTLVGRHAPVTSAIDAYEQFDRRKQGWLRVELEPVG